MSDHGTAAGTTRRVLLLVLLRICGWVAVVRDYWYSVKFHATNAYITTCIFILISTLMTFFVVRSETTGNRRCSCLRAFVIAVLQIAIVFEVLGCCSCCVRGSSPPPLSKAMVEMSRRTSLVDRLGQLNDEQRITPSPKGGYSYDDTFIDMMHMQTLKTEDVGRSSSHRSFAKMRHRFVRKLMVISLPEAAYLTCYTLWRLLGGLEKLRWHDGPKCARYSENRTGDEEQFNHWFKDSPHGIIGRFCDDCDKDYKQVFYLRIKHASEKQDEKTVFNPYRYMTRDWTEENNKIHKDFDLYSTYKDAVSQSSVRRWEICDLSETGIGFPGNCRKSNSHPVPEKDQWSRFEDDPPAHSGDSCLNVTGQQCFSYRVERGWRATMKSLRDNGDLFTWKRTLDSIYSFSMIIVAITALTMCLSDIVVWIWIQTDFVKEYSLMVVMFYLFEICSWLPIVLLFSFYCIKSEQLEFLWPFMANLFAIWFVTIMGFYVKPAYFFRTKGRELVSQVIFSACLAPFIFFVNFLYFDRSLTFRHLRKTYYFLRFVFVSCCLYQSPTDIRHPVVVLALLSSIVLALMVWSLIPQKRMQHESAVMEKACGRMEDIVPSQVIRIDAEEVSLALARAPSRDPGECNSMIDVLNTVGDTFEALLLASKTDSPRVRQGVLRVAVEPLMEVEHVLLRQLLPLILPQLLLALRWRTVDNNDDEYCPLSRFVIDRVLTCGSTELITIVYWQLLVLATDRSKETFETYRSVRERFLLVLQKKTFDGKHYEEDFCNSALTLLANQGRLYSQLRSVARWCSQPHRGNHAQKTEFLKTTCLSPGVRQVWQGKKVLAPRQDTDFSFSECLTENPTSVIDQRQLRSGLQLCWLYIRKCCWRCFLKAIRACLCQSCSCCPCYRRKTQEEALDLVREEWEKDYVLWEYEDVDLDLIEPQNTPLPVDPKDPIIGVDARKSFVAHSAVAPVVICCKMGGGYDDRKRMFALKNGDDLRQDALILQIFKLMETAWKENGLAECVLKPYSVLPVSPTEGMLAFVSRSEKISSVIFEYDGDFVKFINSRCPTDKEQGFDLLCGSTAAYCVATFVLGIGDRHLDNLMITEDGRFFHIDFGFVLGSDPKPCAPLVRVPREIVDAIKATGRYERFLNLVGQAYLLLRRMPRLWSALLGLTREAGGNGVDVLKMQGSVSTVLERLHLELNDEAAKTLIVNEIESSAASPLPMLFDKLHQLGLFWH